MKEYRVFYDTPLTKGCSCAVFTKAVPEPEGLRFCYLRGYNRVASGTTFLIGSVCETEEGKRVVRHTVKTVTGAKNVRLRRVEAE